MNNKAKDEVLEEAGKKAADKAESEETQKQQGEGADGKSAGAGEQDASETESSETAGGEKQAGEKEKREEEDMKTQYLRLAADFQNYKRRTEKEKSDIYAYANEKIVTELLDVIDNFERAIVHQGSCADDSMAEGMNMIFKQLKGVLEKNKVEEIEAEGKDFDPNFHHAVMTENSMEYESGKVTQVLQRGYLLNGKVIRPAMVKVAE